MNFYNPLRLCFVNPPLRTVRRRLGAVVPAKMVLFLSLSLSPVGFAQDEPSRTLTPPSAATSTAAPATPGKETPGKWEQELLRDPFWPIGFFPPNWQRKANVQGPLDQGDASGWTVAAEELGKLISGTSRLGDRTAAIINGNLKSIGEQVEILYNGKVYQWEIMGIGANGQIQLKKIGIR